MSEWGDVRKLIKSLNEDQRKTLKYFCVNRSVGELLALKELQALHKVKEPGKAIAKLVELGVLIRGQGCYSISKSFLNALKEAGVRIDEL
ncbi:MAG: hypothetical protein LM561_05185 [Desulfurococcaceae archaeon]|nr:hypothetical protein [Desulfurococcaceae archaeon]